MIARFSTFVLLVLAVLAQPATSLAQTDAEAQARAHFAAGREHVDAARWTEAYAEFERGYALSHRPLFLFNMAECAREAGQTSRARRDYALYLEADAEGAFAAAARERLAILGPEPQPQAAPDPIPRADASSPDPAAPPAAPAIATPTVPAAALAVDDAREDDRNVELWEDWPFWTIVGVVVVGAAAATTAGILASEGQNGTPACDAGCLRIDWR